MKIDSRLTGQFYRGFRIDEATDLVTARNAITLAQVTGSTGATDIEYESADWSVPIEQRKIERFAKVTRL